MGETDFYVGQLEPIKDGNHSKKILFTICGNGLADGVPLTPAMCAACKLKKQSQFSVAWTSSSVSFLCSGWDNPNIRLMKNAYTDPSVPLQEYTHAIVMARPVIYDPDFETMSAFIQNPESFDPEEDMVITSHYPIAPCGLTIRY